MENLTRIAIVMTMFLALGAYENAKEAHRHTHELACHVQADDLCKYHEATK